MRPVVSKLLFIGMLAFIFYGAAPALAVDLSKAGPALFKDAKNNTLNAVTDQVGIFLPGTRIETEGGITDLHFSGSITAIQPLWYSQSDAHHVFTQATWSRTTDDKYADTLSTGLSYRHLNADKNILLGANLFIDHAYKRNHNRLGIGVDFKNEFLGFAINRYQALSQWKTVDEVLEERVLSGWDMELSGQLSTLPSWTARTRAYKWDNYDGAAIYGYTAGLEYVPIDLVSFNFGLRDENKSSPSAEIMMNIRWSFDHNLKEQTQLREQITPVSQAVYSKVRRENRIRLAQRVRNTTPVAVQPTGYSVAFTTGPVTPANASSISFVLSGGEIGATYDYVLSSSGGAASITGTGTVTSAPQNFNGINVSSLQDGTLSLSITLTNTTGQGSAVNDSVIKNARYVCSVVPEDSAVNLTAPPGEVFTSVDFASYGTPTGSCGNFAVGACDASTSVSRTAAEFVGNTTGSLTGSNSVFGDPCGGTLKQFAVQLRY